jgi:hypothetical protein
MKWVILSILFGLSLSQIACAAASQATTAPFAPPVPEGLGVNIHFTDPRPGEMKVLAAGGFTIVRMDFTWDSTEKVKGQYDFSRYDRLLAALEPHKIKVLFILDYGNRLYDDGNSPCSDDGRKAFARWAAAAVRHFRGKNILWEMWNEPNIGFWKPRPNVSDYVKLALEVGRSIREAEPGETYIGPATSGVDFVFLESCFKAGLLEYWSAVSVHPYRQSPPETVVSDYARLRRMIDQYAPKGKRIPILSGEWGYSAVWGKFDVDRQGKYLPRQWMINLACDVPVSIWYDWHDDGGDPKEPEHHFGTVLYPYDPNKDPVYDPKPAYKAAQTLTRTLAGFRFNKRLAVGDTDDYVMLFSRGDDVRLAAWTVSATPRTITIPASPGKFSVTGHTGEGLPAIAADANGLKVTVTDSPQYLVPEAPNDLLRLAAAWEPLPSILQLQAGRNVTVATSLRNPLARVIVVTCLGRRHSIDPGRQVVLTQALDLKRASDSPPLRLEWLVEGVGTICQTAQVVLTNPLRLSVLPVAGKTLSVRVENPSGEPFKGALVLTDLEGLKLAQPKAALDLQPGEKEKVVRFAADQTAAGECKVGVRIEDDRGGPQGGTGPVGFRPVDDFARYDAGSLPQAYKMVGDGDAKVASTQTVAAAAPSEGPPSPGVGCLKIAYTMDQGWKFIRMVPQTDELKKIDGQPKALGMWIFGDASGHSPRLRFIDSTGQCFQPIGESITWKGWRYVTFPMTADRLANSHWGGANDGAIHYPIRWDTLILLDKAREQNVQAEVYIAAPTLVR